MGLPAWHLLVNQCVKEAGLPPARCRKTTPNIQLRKKIDAVVKASGSFAAYQQIVHKSLYKHVNAMDAAMLNKPLLVALGALMCGSCRGRVSTVLTLNFDNILEAYLNNYGLDTQVICDENEKIRKSDATIFHLHGYLPFNSPAKGSNFLTFGQKSYVSKLRKDIRDPMWDTLVDIMTQKFMLFVGLSGEDMTFEPIFEEALARMQSPFIGIWLFGSDPGQDKLDEIRELGCAPLVLDGFDKYPDFILKICQLATRRGKSS